MTLNSKTVQITRAELNYETDPGLNFTKEKSSSLGTVTRVVPKSRIETQRSVGAIVMPLMVACGVRKHREILSCAWDLSVS